MMNLRQALTDTCFKVNLEATTKDGIITEMVDLLVAAGKLTDRPAALKALMDRERKMSTGMQSGVAIPHGKTHTVSDLIAAFAMKKDGVDFGSMDGQPSRIFIMTLSPTQRTGPHMEYLAEISKVLNNTAVRQRLLECTTVEAMLQVLCPE